MLERLKLDNTILYQSPLLRGIGVPHAFGTKHGDADALAQAIGLDQHDWVTVKQVHGTTIARTGGCDADAVLLDDATQATRIVTADCVPVLLATLDGRRVAAVHAGWRGLVAGILERAAQQLDAPFLAAIGPCISPAHFEVGPEVAEHFDPAFVLAKPDANPHADLPAAAAAKLRAAGAQAIDTTDRCTYRHANDFYSHRRDVTHQGRSATGRMVSIVAPR